jgi:RimJ/RimL family protein N-acetyltransferase
MELIPLDDAAMLRLASRWLAEGQDSAWLDLGGSEQGLSAGSLRRMIDDEAHIVRAFTSDKEGLPIGLVALSSVNPDFRTAVLWAFLADRDHEQGGYLRRAASAMLTLGFVEHGLECINAWTLEDNQGSLRVLQELNFRPIGRERRAQSRDGRDFDKLLFEIMAAEHRSDDARDARTAG